MVCSFRPSNGIKGIIEDIIDLFQSRKGKRNKQRKRVINQQNNSQKIRNNLKCIDYYININELNSPMKSYRLKYYKILLNSIQLFKVYTHTHTHTHRKVNNKRIKKKKDLAGKLKEIKQNNIVSEVTRSCPTLCDPVDCSPPGSSVHGMLQARILEWGATPFSRGVFPTQGWNPGLLHCRWILYCLSHQGIPKRHLNMYHK